MINLLFARDLDNEFTLPIRISSTSLFFDTAKSWFDCAHTSSAKVVTNLH